MDISKTIGISDIKASSQSHLTANLQLFSGAVPGQ